MLKHPEIDPVLFQLGPLSIHWYGLMYLIAFLAFWYLGKYRVHKPGSDFTEANLSDMFFYGSLGVILGGRLGYVFFYGFDQLVRDPLYLIRIWDGGMSFHGGLIGVLVAMALFARKVNQRFFTVMDFVAPLVPVGLGAGRIGNFIGAELWGRPTDVSWGMWFPQVDASPLARHPSQLYQAFLEGAVMFVVLWLYSKKRKPTMAVTGLFALMYGVFRFAVEFFRQPDQHLNFIAMGWLTMGQILSLPLVICGLVFILLAYRREKPMPFTRK